MNLKYRNFCFENLSNDKGPTLISIADLKKGESWWVNITSIFEGVHELVLFADFTIMYYTLLYNTDQCKIVKSNWILLPGTPSVNFSFYMKTSSICSPINYEKIIFVMNIMLHKLIYKISLNFYNENIF